MAQAKELTLKEQLFLDYLFEGETIRHPDEAKQLAGYEKDYPVQKILKNITTELIKRCDDYLALYSPHGVVALIDIIRDPTQPGAKIKQAAIDSLLDRAGVVKKDKTEVTQNVENFMFVLPAKNEIKEN